MHTLLVLPEGRRVAYAVHGDPQGAPVILLPGLAGSRLIRHPDEGLTRATGARLVTIDRPGYGSSDRLPRRSLAAVAGDVRLVADDLGVDRFAVVGVGAGSAFALATAAELGERVNAVSLVSALPWIADPAVQSWLGPQLQRIARMARLPALLAPALVHAATSAVLAPERTLGEMVQASQDRALWDSTAVRDLLSASLRTALEQGSGGLYDDVRALYRPWGITAADVTAPVQVWHGDADAVVTVEAGRALAAGLPDAALTVVPEAGHLLWLVAWTQILSSVLAPERPMVAPPLPSAAPC